jgi:hypothetical protein
MNDSGFIEFAAGELEKIGLIHRRDVVGGTLVRVHKAYPAYFGSYGELGRVRKFLDQFSNLYPVGRNGMHRYNNQDHSMLAAKLAVDSILDHGKGKERIITRRPNNPPPFPGIERVSACFARCPRVIQNSGPDVGRLSPGG